MAALSLRSRAVGSLAGLAVCDAVGTTVEFQRPGSFPPLEDMIGGGKFNLLPGQWTDDTSMALCLAESLVECRAFNPVDQTRRYQQWYEEGHLSSNGECFDIGMTTRKALNQFQRSGQKEPYCGPTSDRAAGNGSLMRLCPVPLAYHRFPEVAMMMAQDSSRTTHGAKAAMDACRYFSGLIIGCLRGASKEQLLSPYFSPISENYWKEHPLESELDEVVRGSYKRLEPPEITASGYVVKSLEAVLWAFHHTSNFKDGCLKVVNLGRDADTVGAIFGQLAGAFYGVEEIPEDWRQKCSLYNLIELFATELLSLAEAISAPEEPLLDSTDWDSKYSPLPDSELSESYVNIKKKGYHLLESHHREIVRRLNPCPKSYKRLEDFDEAVSSLEEKYRNLPEECQNAGILADFQKRWTDARTKLELKLGRGRV